LADTFQDKAYIAECEKRLESDSPASGEDIAENLVRAYKASSDAVRQFSRYISPGKISPMLVNTDFKFLRRLINSSALSGTSER
jgi:hypothetical protein